MNELQRLKANRAFLVKEIEDLEARNKVQARRFMLLLKLLAVSVILLAVAVAL